MANTIILNRSDYKKLDRIIKLYKETNRLKTDNLLHLAAELQKAVVVDDSESLTDVVRINSTVVYKNLKTNKLEKVSIVFPADTSHDGSRVSILSPLGTALIGEEENNITDCYTPNGIIQLKVEKIVSYNTLLQY